MGYRNVKGPCIYQVRNASVCNRFGTTLTLLDGFFTEIVKVMRLFVADNRPVSGVLDGLHRPIVLKNSSSTSSGMILWVIKLLTLVLRQDDLLACPAALLI